MNSQPFLAAFYCREGRGFMWTGFVKAVVQIFVLCSLAAKGWVQTTSPFKVPLACYKRLIQFWLCYGPPARFAGCVRCSSAPLHSLGQRQSHDRAMLQGWKSSCTRKRFGRESGYKKDTFGISSHCYDSVYTSSFISSIRMLPGKAGSSHKHPGGYLLSEAVPSCRHCITWFVLTAGKENSKGKKIHRKVLACGFSAQVRLGLLCKWPRIRSDYQDCSV